MGLDGSGFLGKEGEVVGGGNLNVTLGSEGVDFLAGRSAMNSQKTIHLSNWRELLSRWEKEHGDGITPVKSLNRKELTKKVRMRELPEGESIGVCGILRLLCRRWRT